DRGLSKLPVTRVLNPIHRGKHFLPNRDEKSYQINPFPRHPLNAKSTVVEIPRHRRKSTFPDNSEFGDVPIPAHDENSGYLIVALKTIPDRGCNRLLIPNAHPLCPHTLRAPALPNQHIRPSVRGTCAHLAKARPAAGCGRSQ